MLFQKSLDNRWEKIAVQAYCNYIIYRMNYFYCSLQIKHRWVVFTLTCEHVQTNTQTDKLSPTKTFPLYGM